jgi:hypothetical protein
VEHRQVVVGQADHLADHGDREREQQLLHQIRVAPAAERVHEVLDDGADDVHLPRLHRLAREGLLDERAVRVMLGLVHLEDRVAEEEADGVRVPRRRERVAVSQDLLHCVEAQDVVGRAAVLRDVLLDTPPAELVLEAAGVDRALTPQLLPHRERVADGADPGTRVELGEGVMGVVDLGAHVAHALQPCTPGAVP